MKAGTRTNTLRLPPGPDNPRNSEGAFARLPNGRVIYIYTRYCGESWDDHAVADLALRYSDDDGASWSHDDHIVIDRNRDTNVINYMSVSLLNLRDGRILLAYIKKSRSHRGLINCAPMVTTLDPETLTAAPGKAVVESDGYFVIANDRLVELQCGRIILPVAYHREKGDNFDRRGIGLIYYSDDRGDTFQEAPGWLLPPQNNDNGLQEPGVVELGNGDLMCFMRTDIGSQYLAYSRDQGLHWSVARPSEFLSPLSPMSIKRHPGDGRLVAVWNDLSPRWGMPAKRFSSPGWGEGPSGGRTPLVMAESFDDGRSWQNHQMLENDPESGFCYIAMFFTANALLLAYCCGGRDNTIMLQHSKIQRIALNHQPEESYEYRLFGIANTI